MDATDWLASADLPAAWRGRAAWTVLDAAFAEGAHFLATWQAWQSDPQRPALLHYVGVASRIPATFTPPSALAGHPGWRPLWDTLLQACADRGPGFHRIRLAQGRLSLTLCIGPVRAMLLEHSFVADTLRAWLPCDTWAAQLLARRCRRGTRCSLHPIDQHASSSEAPANGASPERLVQGVGFERTAAADDGTWVGQFNPHWEIRRSRNQPDLAVTQPARCAVVGAGLSGASVARALALRGWQVSVYDQEAAPARAASGLPAGLCVPHVSVDDSPRSRLSRIGSRLSLQHAQELLVCGQDWAPSGVEEHSPGTNGLWHAHAGWIKPAALVAAWLDHPAIRWVGLTAVDALVRTGSVWQLHDSQGRCCGEAELVVLANALGCVRLLRPLLATAGTASNALSATLAGLHAVHGTLSSGGHIEALEGLPAAPRNGHGCFIPNLPGSDGLHWVAGSTYTTDAVAASDVWEQHARNMQRLQHLLGADGAALVAALERGPLAPWSATRCVAHDRLPLLG
ncbi:MAG: FAD-dependent oxidoreductase, partial [Rhodoferax sp.]